MRQIALFPGVEKLSADLVRDTFSHHHVCPETARQTLEARYAPYLMTLLKKLRI
jgi:hypothetical protein